MAWSGIRNDFHTASKGKVTLAALVGTTTGEVFVMFIP